MNEQREELIRLTNRQLDAKLSEVDQQRLVQLLNADAQLVDLYTEILCLHGQLTWDAGQSVGLKAEGLPEVGPAPITSETVAPRKPWRFAPTATIAALLVAVVGGYLFVKSPWKDANNVAVVPEEDASDNGVLVAEQNPNASEDIDLTPLDLSHPKGASQPTVVAQAPQPAVESPGRPALADNFSDDDVIAGIDGLIQQSWANNEITPTVEANDAEWMRRAYLTLAGRIPSLEESHQFLTGDSPRKRRILVDRLLTAPERNEHLATTWTNLLVGRTERPGVNRDKLFEFLTESFTENSPWIDTVGELITASGRNDENGATNFLLAHLNNQATPATAVTARLFMGEQISCVQCHDHPFSNGVSQEDYWALNAFFKDTVKEALPEAEGANASGLTARLIDRPKKERMTHFEDRSGNQKAVLPKYDGHVIAEASQENRRQRLAKLLASDGDRKIARAMVNRTWAHFFGFGFTNPVDDMGPHVPVSHPDVLGLLTEAFVKSDYDLQRLMKWVSLSQAWQLSSVASNEMDMPEHGATPLFSRVYARRMTPEQVYESIRVAIRSASGQPLARDENSLEHRRTWVQQFAHAYGTDENDEALQFDGTIVQALLMMNGSDIDIALRQATQAIVQDLNPRTTESDALDRVALAMLTREPTDSERQAFRNRIRQLTNQSSPKKAVPVAVEDMMWAYLNSSEFVLVH